MFQYRLDICLWFTDTTNDLIDYWIAIVIWVKNGYKECFD
jgi:hypothetical protein